ncbi:hypothetical protein MJM99_34585, partial [Salmonella enterica subsp. enterica serovar Kentucky]|nr:hypothetical protein [Salmonella enterica subsp. enterica serovar Kentucky]
AIHRAAPSYEELSNSQELLETGIKVIDLMCPFAKGGKVGLFGAGYAIPRSRQLLARWRNNDSAHKPRANPLYRQSVLAARSFCH